MKRQQVEYWDSYIYWHFNGEWHRDKDLPARYFFRDGKLSIVAYHQHDKPHCTTGPAFIYYDRKIKRYYYHGMRYASLEEMLMMEACR